MQNIHYCLPQGMTSETFLAEYWQKKPLLIKQGLPQLIDMFEPEDILDLATDPEASARLITQITKAAITEAKTESDYQWNLKNSPLVEGDFDHLPNQWTVLVQNLEQWSPDLGQLWKAFDFIPQWQRDDIMVSFAPKGGSVGKHYDDYDVFLAQGYGHRRWQLGKYCDEHTEFVSGQPIRIFDDMGDIIFDEILEAGDVLYVPPKLSHNGIAQDDCMTFSFGFRRPNLMQVLDGLADVATTDPSLFVPMILPQIQQTSGSINEDSIQSIKKKLIDILASEKGDNLIRQTVCEIVSKRQYDILTPEEILSDIEVNQYLNDGASLQIDYNSRLLYHNADDNTLIYANGQLIDDLNQEEINLLVRLADGDRLYISDLKDIEIDTVLDWLENGWIWIDY